MMRRSTVRPSALKSSLFAVCLLLMLSPVGQAQDMSAVVTISIERQPLSRALTGLAEQTGWQIIFAEQDVRDYSSEVIQGSYPISQVLDTLLEKTDLTYSVQGETTIIVRGRKAVETSRFNEPRMLRVVEEVVVTAQRREQRLQDVPISVSVASGEMLQRDGLRQLEDLADRMPNVNIAQVPGSDAITIRGVGSGNDLGFEQSVATFVDGVYRSRSRASRLAFFDIDRIEILRGPQTTFFGNNAIAGALNITTRKPSHEFETNLSALYSPSDKEYSLDGGVNIPVTDDLAVRIAVGISGMEGYIKNKLLDDYGPELDNKLARVSFRWTSSEILEFEGRVDYAELRDESIYNSEVLNCPPDSEFGTPGGACLRYLTAEGGEVDDKLNHRTVNGPSHFDMDMFEVSLHSSVNLDDYRFVAITSFYDHEYDTSQSLVPTRDASVVNARYGLINKQLEDYRQFSQELRFETTGERTVDLMGGVYYSKSRASMLSAQGYFFARFGQLGGFQPDDPIGIFTVNKPEDEVISAFGASTIHLRPDLRLNLGLRYSKVDKESTRNAAIGLTDEEMEYDRFFPGSEAGQATLRPLLGVAGGGFQKPERSDDKWMPAIAVEYDFGADSMGYASYNKGFKAGGFAVGMLADSFGPETVDAYELGLKTSLLESRLQLSLAVFHSKYRDLQASSFIIHSSGAPIGYIGNVAESTSEGVELSGVFAVAPSLRLSFDLAYLDSRYDNYEAAPCTQLGSLQSGCVQDLKGKSRAFSPRFSGNIGVSHVSPLRDTLELRLDTNLYFSSKYFLQANAEPNSIQSGYGKLDVRIAVGSSDGRWEAALMGKNLTDKTTASYWSPLPSSPGSGQAIADRPRSIALQWLINF